MTSALPAAIELPRVTWESAGVGASVVVGGVVLAWLLKTVVGTVLRWRGRSPSSASVFGHLTSWVVVGLSIGAALAVVFPSVKPVDVLGGVGIISIAVGIAFQTVLGNMFAGIVILARDRFRIGDQIAVQDHRGTVVALGLTSSSLRTFDGRLLLIPNAMLHSDVVTIQTGYEKVRTSVGLDLDEGTDLDVACLVAEQAMRAVPAVVDDPAPQALLSEVGTATVHLELRFWSGAQQLETREAQHAVIKEVVMRFRDAGVDTGSDVLVLEPGPRLAATLDELSEREAPSTGDADASSR